MRGGAGGGATGKVALYFLYVGVTTPAHEAFVTDMIVDNETDGRQGYIRACLLAKPKRARKTVAVEA